MRDDLQGLRGLAVLVVVLEHAFRWPTGGFAGVDIFFVLSGYLITRTLITETGRTGRVDLVGFFAGRARRLLPSAFLVLIATVSYAHLVLNPNVATRILGDAWWAAAFAINWRFLLNGGDYFTNSLDTPLLHYWSLAIEEQFYIVWPLLLWGALVSGRRWRVPYLLAGVAITVLLVSLTFSTMHTAEDPASAYFHTFDRVWEFAIGALVASTRDLWLRIPSQGREIAGWAGALGVLVPVLVLEPSDPYPGPRALAACLCTCLVIVGGSDSTRRWLVIYQNRAMVYLGNVSYAVYLWHFPILYFVAVHLVDAPAWTVGLVGLLVTAVVSPLSFHFVEQPLRFAPWLMPPDQRRRYLRQSEGTRAARRVGPVVVLACVTTVLSVLALTRDYPTPMAGLIPRVDTTVVSEAPPAQAKRWRQIRDAFGQTGIPELVPPVEDLTADGWLAAHVDRGCVSPSLQPDACVPAGRPRAVIIGDSFALSWSPTVAAALPADWSLVQYTQLGCPAWIVRVDDADGNEVEECTAHHDATLEFLAFGDYDLAIAASAPYMVNRPEQGPSQAVGEALAHDGLAPIVEAIDGRAPLVIVQPPPAYPQPEKCIRPGAEAYDCYGRLDSAWFKQSVNEERVADDFDATYVSTYSWFCLERTCPGWIDGIAVTSDGAHLTMPMSLSLVPLLRLALRPVLQEITGSGQGAATGLTSTA